MSSKLERITKEGTINIAVTINKNGYIGTASPSSIAIDKAKVEEYLGSAEITLISYQGCYEYN